MVIVVSCCGFVMVWVTGIVGNRTKFLNDGSANRKSHIRKDKVGLCGGFVEPP